MKRVKKAVAVVLAGVMLCGVAVTANAATREHTHVYNPTSAYVCYNSFSSGTHTYVKNGITGVCTILVNQYRAAGVCSCGETGTVYKTEMQHTSCGQ